MKVEIRSNLAVLPLEQQEIALLVQLLKVAARGEGRSKNTAVSVLFTDDATIRKYNRKFRSVDKATDVLSFPMLDQGEAVDFPILQGLGEFPLGDIIISLERCKAQAEEYHHSIQRELCFLGLHGLLHLLGYDHIEAAEAEIMEARAEKYLQSLGVER